MAQPAGLRLGVEGGPSIAWLRDAAASPEFEHSSRTGYAFGLTLEYPLNHTFGIVTGAGFERKGSSFDFILAGQSLEMLRGKSNFDYVIVPLLVRLQSHGRWFLCVDAGGYLGLLQEQVNFTDPQANYAGTSSDLTDLYRDTDLGLMVAVGGGFAISEKVSVSARGRMSTGLTDTRDDAIRTSSVAFLVGMIFAPWAAGTGEQ